jgi:hypothetical protein
VLNVYQNAAATAFIRMKELVEAHLKRVREIKNFGSGLLEVSALEEILQGRNLSISYNSFIMILLLVGK